MGFNLCHGTFYIWIALNLIHILFVDGAQIRLICPKGPSTFLYDTSSTVSAGKQAYAQCTKICDESKWTSNAAINHCSGPTSSLFIPACDMHDMCYIIPGIGQSNCDQWFKENMVKLCDAQSYCHPSVKYIKRDKYDTNPCTQCMSQAVTTAMAVRQFDSYYFDGQAQGLVFRCQGQSDVIAVQGTIGNLYDVKNGGFRASGKAHAYYMSIGYSSSPYKLTNTENAIEFQFCDNYFDGDVDLIWYGPNGLKIEKISDCDDWVDTKGKGQYLIVLEEDVLSDSGWCSYKLEITDTKKALDVYLDTWSLSAGEYLMLVMSVEVFLIICGCIGILMGSAMFVFMIMYRKKNNNCQ